MERCHGHGRTYTEEPTRSGALGWDAANVRESGTKLPDKQVGEEKTSLQLGLTRTNFLIMFERHLSKCDEIMCSDLLRSWMNS